jgi:hypothetical protein
MYILEMFDDFLSFCKQEVHWDNLFLIFQFLNMEDDLNCFEMENKLNFFDNGRLPQLFGKLKKTSIFF